MNESGTASPYSSRCSAGGPSGDGGSSIREGLGGCRSFGGKSSAKGDGGPSSRSRIRRSPRSTDRPTRVLVWPRMLVQIVPVEDVKPGQEILLPNSRAEVRVDH